MEELQEERVRREREKAEKAGKHEVGERKITGIKKRRRKIENF